MVGKRGNAWRRGHGRCVALPIGLLVAVLGASSPPAHAAAKLVVPDRHGVIHACIGGDDGDELHVVNAGEPCPDHEQALPWNSLGRPGPRGKPGAASEPFAGLLIGLLLIDETQETHKTGGSWVKEASSTAGDWFTLLGLGILALVLALSLARWLLSLPWRWRPLRRWRRLRRIGRFFGPALQLEAFEDGAMAERVGPSFALLVQARIDGGRETGSHLYLVTGEERTGDYVAALQGVPQTQALAVALSLLRLLWRKQRLTVSGSLKPIDDRQTAAATVSLRLDAKLIDTSEFWLGEPPSPQLTPFASNRALAVAVAGWIEHEVIDETPGPPAREVLLSHDSRSWALFRAGSELNRMSLLNEADDLYERALGIDRYNIGALIDLAHLRRLDGHYEGAETLALDALGLIEDRNRALRRRDDEDPNWYRAQIVLATTYSEWGRDEKACKGRPDDVRQRALERAVRAATCAMRARDRLRRLVNPDTLASATIRGKIGVRTRIAARWRALVRHAERPPAHEPSNAEEAPAKREPSDAAEAPAPSAHRRPRREWRTFWQSVVDLHALLATTFEPGALLLVASNVSTTDRLPNTHGAGPPLGPAELEDLRNEVKLQPITAFQRAAAIDYVAELPNKSPRVLYNLCCWYAREARNAEDAKVDEYLGEAFELLRQSISRTPPLERRSLLSHAELDRDLNELRPKYSAEIAGLWRLVPTEEARLRGLDGFVQTAIEWADKTAEVQGLAVVGPWAQGHGGAGDPVSVVLRTDKLDRFTDSNDWLEEFDHPALLQRWRTPSLYKPRIELRSGLTIEFWIAGWDRITADPDIRALAGEGYEVLRNRAGDLEELLAALARAAHTASRPSCSGANEI